MLEHASFRSNPDMSVKIEPSDKNPDQLVWATIIIINYNAGSFLQKAIDSVAAQTERSFELIILDNASTDGSMDNLQTAHIPNVQIVRLDKNVGFAQGNNEAAALARGEWLALLNPDAEAAEDWLAEFRSATCAYPDTVLFAGTTINMKNTDLLDGAGDYYFFLGIPWRGGYTRPREELPPISECFSACAAAALVKKESFLEIGGFDERYFCYCEDVDLAFRLRLRGHRCVFWPTASALHYGSGTTSVGSSFSVRLGMRNRVWMFIKDMPPLAFWTLFPIHLLANLLIILRGVMTGRANASYEGFREALVGLGPVWRDRKTVQRSRRVSSFTALKAMSWNWFLVRNKKTDTRRL
ncbi:MAG: glycosyltransferase family 2 protein [Pseudomonadota bacterium]